MVVPDVWITSASEPRPVGFGLLGHAELSYVGGGWATVERPRRQDLVEWTGIPLRQLKAKLLLEHPDAATSVEPQLAQVSAWMWPTRATGEPPTLRLDGPIDQQGVRTWVCTALGYGTTVIRAGRHRVQQDIDVTLLERQPQTLTAASLLSAQLQGVAAVLASAGVAIPAQVQVLLSQLPSLAQTVPASVLTSVSTQLSSLLAVLPSDPGQAAEVATVALPRVLATLRTLGGARRYVVRDGDTLARIAARELGDFRRWPQIAELSGIRDPAAVLPGTVLVLP